MRSRAFGGAFRLFLIMAVCLGMACTPSAPEDADDSAQTLPLPFDGAAAAGLDAVPVSAQALSQHYVELTFDRPVGAEAEDLSLYTIIATDAAPLAVMEVRRRGTDAKRVLLVTEKQRPVPYELSVQQSQPASKMIRQAAVVKSPVVFSGSTTIEPFLATAIALTQNTVLVTFGGAMDNNVLLPANYQIVNPQLTITNIEYHNAATGSSVVLTTSDQEGIAYTIRATNLTTANGSKLLDPTRSTAVFHGITPNTPLSVSGAAAASAASVLVSFNKPLADDAAEASHFVVTPEPPFSGAPALVVTAAEMARYNTQVRLTTMPMNAGWSYKVTVVGNVRDRERLNVIGTPNSATFLYVGSPCVLSAVSLGSKKVLVTYDTAMDSTGPTAATHAANYSIANPDLAVVGVSLVNGYQNRVVELTTEDQEDIEYVLRVSNVTAGGGTKVVDPACSTATFNGTAPGAPLTVTGASAAGSTAVLVSFSRPLADDAAETTHFSIEPTWPDATAPDLVITAADMSPNKTQIRLTTSPMIAGWQYLVTVTGVRDGEARSPIQTPNTVPFTFIAAPGLISATGLSHTEILLVYNAAMDSSAIDPVNYSVLNPDLSLSWPQFVANSWNTMVKLTTSPQENVDYTLQASGAITGGGGIPLDPGQRKALFSGVSSEEALQLTNTVSTGATTVLVSFNKPLANDSAEPTYFKIASLPPAGYQPADLTITGAELSRNGTQVKLTTMPMTAGWSYRLTVVGVRDRDRRVQMTPAQTYDFTFVVSPGVLGAIALDSTHVLVTFDAAMDSNVLNASNYTISDPDLTVIDADFVPHSQNTAVKLLTSGQQSLNYMLLVANVTSGGGTRPLDPARSTAAFNGIAPNAPLVVSGAVATSATTVLVSFNKPLTDDAADPTNFEIPELVVTSAVMSLYNTQVQLTTLPMIAGQEYTVTVSKVRDRERSQVIKPPGNQATFMYDGPPNQSYLPRMVGAISESNTSVIVSYNKRMGPSAAARSNYSIVQLNVNSEVGTLMVMDAEFVDGSHTSVRLTTSSQSEVTYRVTAVNVKDASGNGLHHEELLVDPSTDTFAGTPPSVPPGGSALDLDGDGLNDNIELRGYVVTIVGSDGEAYQIQVTSDPFLKDTDADGLDDLVERQIRTDPRNYDTDSDGISDFDEFNVYYSSPTHQDTDGDELDDNLEIFFFKTSSLFDDTDGDGLEDGDEINAGNRDPLIADLPEPGILIGEVALRLDTRFQYTDTEGNSQKLSKSNQATLHQSQEKKFAQSDTETTKHELEAGFEGGYDGGAVAKGTVKYTFARENQFQASTESTTNTQREYQNTLSTEVARDITQAVQRTVEGASIDLVVTLGNFSDIPFTMSNIEVTALMQDPYNRTKLSPIASLLPASMLTSGDFEVFLGPFIQERGPFIFKSTNVFPSMVEDLMKNPRGLIFKVANFDITDEQGRNFAYISQDVNDRTAGIIIDYGNGQVDKYRVATSSTFDANTGKPKGITMAYALQGILGMEKDGVENAITVGDNGCAETFATGDDVQVVIPVCQAVAAGGTIVTAGPNGLLETLPLGDDMKSSDGLSIVDGGDGCAQTRAQRDDVQVVAAQCVTGGLDGIVVLAGKNGKIDTTPAEGDELTAISGYATQYVGQCGSEPGDSDYDYIIEPRTDGNGYANTVAAVDDEQLVVSGDPVKPGQPIIGPGPNGVLNTAPGGDDIVTCRPIERLVRVKGVKDKPEQSRFWAVIGPPDMAIGTDFDELPLKAGNVYTLAYVQDQDHDGLYAREEFLYGSSDRDDNSDGCPLGDGHEDCDTNIYDFDTVWDFDEVRTGWLVQVTGQSGYVTYSNPVQPDSDADRLFDDEERAMGTDAGKRDSDDDGISDYDEVRGYQVLRRDDVLIRNVVPYQSAVIAVGNNGTLDTARVGDDELNADLKIITPGSNGVLDSVPDGDDVLEGTAIILDGGNGEPETFASGDDIQVGPEPVPTRTVTVTFLDFEPGSSSGDGEGPGEFVFNLFARQGDEESEEVTVTGLVSAYETHTFDPELDGTAKFVFEDVAATDTITFGADIIEDDPACSLETRSVIIEPLTTGNRLADTLAATFTFASQIIPLDHQAKTFAGPTAPGDIVISSCDPVPLFDPLGLINSTPGIPGLCKPFITAGPNGIADTRAGGDDEQLVFKGTTDLDPTANVIGPGPNGLMDTTPEVDDVLLLPYGPVAPYPCEPYIAEPLTGDGKVRTKIPEGSDDVYVSGLTYGGDVTPGRAVVLPGPNGVIESIPAGDQPAIVEPLSGGDLKANTTACRDGAGAVIEDCDDVQEKALDVTVSAGDVIISAGPDGILQTAPSGDDKPAIIEPLSGGNGYADTTAAASPADDVQTIAPGDAASAGAIIVSAGSNGVLETEASASVETRVVRVPVDGLASSCPSGKLQQTTDCSACPSGECYGDDELLLRSPADSCEQAWTTDDPLACPCGTCLKYNTNPPSAFERWTPEQVTLRVSDVPGNGVTVALSNGPGSFGSAVLRVKVEVTPGAAVPSGAVLVRAGPNGRLDTAPSGDDVLGVPHLTLYASNPLDRDTDADTLFDGAERILGSNPNDALDAQRYRDNDLDGLPNGVEVEGWVLGYTDGQGVLQCLTNSGTMTVEDEYDPPAACLRVTSDPFEPDTDFDGLPDLLEYLVHSDARSPDTDGDGLLDYDEFDPKSRFSIPTLVMREFQRRCAEAPRCAYTPTESPHGTSVVLADTDTDGLSDRQEVEEYWIIAPCSAESGYVPGLPRKVFSSPLTADFDLDNLVDGQEKALLLDPLNPDTDGDGKPDNSDGTPDGCGKIVTITFLSYAVDNNCQATGKGDFKFRFTVRTPHGDVLNFNQDFSLSDNSTHTFPSSFTATFTMRDGDTFGIDGQVKEPDSASADEVWTLNERVYDYSVTDAEVVIGPEVGEPYSSCYGNHKLTLQFVVGQD